jgi:DNA recombination protein RmuC
MISTNTLASVVDISNSVLFFLGAAAGAAGAWLVLRGRIALAYQRATSDASVERAALTERLQAKEEQLSELRHAHERMAQENAEVGGAFRLESEKRAAAEEKNCRLPALEEVLLERDAQIAILRDENSAQASQISALQTVVEQERKSSEEKLAVLNDASGKLSDAFKVLSADALRTNNQSFLDLAKETLERFNEGARSDLETRQRSIDDLVKPIKEALDRVDGKIHEIEVVRASAYSGLTEQVKQLAATESQLQSETAKLVRALGTPKVRGRWGEMQLKRVVEIAGMVPYCDFGEQESVKTEDGRLRPDMVIKLPGGKNIVVDAKAPIEAYMDAFEARDDETRESKMKDHARQVRAHIAKLSAKAYWEQFDQTPEFVFLFLPGEMFYSAALEHDPGLIEYAVESRVIPASPTTLIALLKAVGYGWRQEQIAENAQAISELGRTLYDRIAILASHFAEVGKHLDRTVGSYNKTVGSFETRVLVQARKFKELGASAGDEIGCIDVIEKAPRCLSSIGIIGEGLRPDGGIAN